MRSDKVEGGSEGGQNKRVVADDRFVRIAGSPRHLHLPMAVISALVALIEALPDIPDRARAELRSAIQCVRRAYRIPDRANEVELAWMEEPDAEIPTEV